MAANAVEHAADRLPPPGAPMLRQAVQRWLRQHAFWLLVVLGLGLVVLGTEFGRLTVDTRPEIYLDPWRATREALSAWSTVPGLGQASFQVGLAPVAAFVGVLQSIGLPAWLSMRLLRWALMVLAAAGMWRLAGAVPGPGHPAQVWARRAAVVAFVANPYVVAAGATLPVLWPYALLPWQVWTVLRAMATGRWLGWAVVFGLVTAAMTGQNAGAVPALQLVALPVALLWGARACGRGPRVVLGFLFSGGAVALMLSAYWLLPSLAAVGSGSTIVGESESLAAISQTSSFAEVIRGMGLWPLYGRTGSDPWVPAQAALLTSPLVVAAGFVLPLTAWLLVRRAPRAVLRLPVSLIGLAALVMVGVHPYESPSPVGRLWRWLLEVLPPLGVLRTTNKAGAVLVLGVALLVALGVASSRRPRVGAATVVVVALVSSLPGWTGGMYTSSVDVPQYWRDASRVLATAPARVWLLPGETSANYRWSDPRPDDVGQSLIAPESVVRTTVSNTSPQGSNLLAAVDRRLQQGTLPPALLAAAARYLGVSTIVVRNDVVWEEAGGAGPHTVSDEVRGSSGLVLSGTFGEPTPASGGEPQLAVYTVQEPVTMATLAPTRGRLVVAGDGNAMPSLATLGYLDGQPTIEYASDLTTDRLAEVADDGGRVVLTDTNRREAAVPGRLTEDHGPILSADQPVQATQALGGPADQSVRVPRGWTAAADIEGSVFRPLPWASADNAVDGDPSTAWFAGDYGGAVGRVLSVDFHETMPPGRLRVSTVGIGRAAITGLSVTANGESYGLVAEGDGVFGVDVPVRVATLELKITGVVPQAPENVGIDEVSWSGAVSGEPDSVRTPRTLSDLVDGLPGDRRRGLSAVPIDVVLDRVPGVSASAWKEETNLSRDVVLPWSTSSTVRGLFTVGTPMAEQALDEVAGDRSGNRVTSSSQAFGLPTVRASMALDGDGGTGWSPSEPATGQTWQVALARPRTTSRITVTQPDVGRQITRVELTVNREAPRSVDLGPGTTRIELGSAVDVGSVRLRLLAVSEPAREPARLLEVGIGGARVERTSGPQGCLIVGAIDGDPVRVRPTSPITGASFLASDCDPSRTLGTGVHQWRPVQSWVGETVVWAGEGSRRVPSDRLSVTTDPDRVGSGWTADLPARSESATLVSGVGYDRRWHLTVAGRDLGPPSVVDGFTAGWRVAGGAPVPATLSYAPQQRVWLGLALSGGGLLSCLIFLVLRWRTLGAEVHGGGRSASAPRARATAAWRAVSGRLTTRRGATLVRVAGWLLLGGLALGWWGLPLALLGLVVRELLPSVGWWLAAAFWAAVPVAWFVQAAPYRELVTPDLAVRTPVAHVLAGGALLLSLMWAWSNRPSE